MRIILSRILWLQGFADQAEEVAAAGLELAQGPGVCIVLAWASCPIAFWRGDLDAACALTGELLSHSRRINVEKWTRVGLCYQATLELLAGKTDAITPFLENPLEMMPNGVLSRDILATICPAWISEHTRDRAQRGLAGWATPELLRAEGERQLRDGAVAVAEARFDKAIAVARDQVAVAWELRASMSLARLWGRLGRSADALDLLVPVVNKVAEGRSTADLTTARALIVALMAKPHSAAANRSD